MKKENKAKITEALVGEVVEELKKSLNETLAPRIDMILSKFEEKLKTKKEEPTEIHGTVRATLVQDADGRNSWMLYIGAYEFDVDSKDRLIEKWGLVVDDKDTE